MSIEMIGSIVAWLKDFRSDPVTFTFHGGEPLLAGADFYQKALPLLTNGLQDLEPNFALQTNLWKLTPDLAEILAKYKIPIGSSLDGPQELNDLQRSEGYYERTMRGYELARPWASGAVHLHLHLPLRAVQGGYIQIFHGQPSHPQAASSAALAKKLRAGPVGPFP